MTQKLENKEKKIDDYQKAVFVLCHTCAIEYIEQRQWLFENMRTECPYCSNEMVLGK